MGFWDDPIGNIFKSPIINPVGAINISAIGSYNRANTPGAPFSMAQLQPRKNALRNRIISDEQIDDITREEILKELSGSRSEANIDALEEAFVKKRSSDSPLFATRRAVTNANKKSKEQPGIRAQTLLTQGNSLSPAVNSSAATLLTGRG